MIGPPLVAAAVAFAFAVALTRALASGRGGLVVLDHPNERSLHAVPTPRTGGIAIAAGVLIAPLVVASMAGVPPAWVVWTIGSAMALAAISFCDDRWSLSPLVRFVLQSAVVFALVARGGTSLSHLTVPLVGTIDLGAAAPIIAIAFIVWMANLYNFMDGMDGLAGGMTVIGFIGVAALAGAAGDLWLAAIAAAVAGAAAGFLPYNLPPARIFMGDVGSVPLGLLAGALAVRAAATGAIDIWISILIFSPFIVDATVVVVLRSLRGERIWRAHRQHCYQRLVLAGWTRRRTLTAEYVLAAIAGLSAFLYARSAEAARLGLLVGWTMVYVVLFRAVNGVESHTGPSHRADAH